MTDVEYRASLVSGSNPLEVPVFVWGYPGADASDVNTRLTRKALLRPMDVERAAALLLAEFSGLTLDVNVFRGGLPAALESGFGVVVSGEIPETEPGLRKFELTCAGRDTDPDRLKERFSRFLGKLPLRDWVTVSSCRMVSPITLARIVPAGRAGYETVAALGRECTRCGATLYLTVCVAPDPPCGGDD